MTGCRSNSTMFWCGALIERLEDEVSFFISIPVIMQSGTTLEKDQVYSLRLTSSRGFYEFDVRAIGKDSNDNVSLMKLLVVSEPRRMQRRNAFRIDILIDVVICEIPENPEPEKKPVEYLTKTINVSESGMLFLSERDYNIGTWLNCELVLNRYGFDMVLKNIKAKVVRRKKRKHRMGSIKSALILRTIPCLIKECFQSSLCGASARFTGCKNWKKMDGPQNETGSG